tara:strand:- start:345 stop:464 length:120 start_codon:yes stop_codon:yes gene_type:complete
MTDFTFETLMSQNVKKTDLLVFFCAFKNVFDMRCYTFWN